MRGSKLYGIVAAAFMAGAFLASPELRAYAAATITSADIVDGTIKSVDIGNGQVKAADIATDAVGASEIAGVTKLLFLECTGTDNSPRNHGEFFGISCPFRSAQTDDMVIATHNGGNVCFGITTADVVPAGTVRMVMTNNCAGSATLGSTQFSIILFDKD